MATTDNNIRLVAAGVSQDELSYDQSLNEQNSSSDEILSATSKTETEEVLVKHQTQAVNRSKLLVYLALIITTVAVGATAFLSTKEIKKDFGAEVRLQGNGRRPNKTENHYLSAYNNPCSFTQFTGLTLEAIEKAESNVLNTVIAIKGPRVAMTSNIIDGNNTHPNVTMPYIDLRTHEALVEGSSKIAFPSIILMDLTPNAALRARKISNFTDPVTSVYYEEFY